MTSWPGQPAPPKGRPKMERMADSGKRTFMTDQEVQAEAVKIARLLIGLTVAEAKQVLQTCGEIICSTIVITDSDVAAIAAEFQGASER